MKKKKKISKKIFFLTQEKISLLRKACDTHMKVGNDCKNGHGLDRHLYGMLWLAKQRQQRVGNHAWEIPALYRDKGWSILRTDLLSTSNCGNHALSVFGFGPTADEGLGLGYMIKDDVISVNVTSWVSGDAEKFGKLLGNVLEEMMAVVKSVGTEGPKSKL